MSTTYPIKSEEKLEKFKEYYLLKKPICRNYTMIILGLNTAFRISEERTLFPYSPRGLCAALAA